MMKMTDRWNPVEDIPKDGTLLDVTFDGGAVFQNVYYDPHKFKHGGGWMQVGDPESGPWGWEIKAWRTAVGVTLEWLRDVWGDAEYERDREEVFKELVERWQHADDAN